MAYIVRSKGTGMYFMCGKENYEFYWVKDPIQASQFKSPLEVATYVAESNIDDVSTIEILDAAAILLSDVLASTPTVGSIPEGTKFQYATGGGMVFMKICQPTDKLIDWTHGECDARRYLHASTWGIWVVILESKNDCKAIAIGKVILLNSGILVRILQ